MLLIDLGGVLMAQKMAARLFPREAERKEHEQVDAGRPAGV